jgi:hypothetical protein
MEDPSELIVIPRQILLNGVLLYEDNLVSRAFPSTPSSTFNVWLFSHNLESYLNVSYNDTKMYLALNRSTMTAGNTQLRILIHMKVHIGDL